MAWAASRRDLNVPSTMPLGRTANRSDRGIGVSVSCCSPFQNDKCPRISPPGASSFFRWWWVAGMPIDNGLGVSPGFERRRVVSKSDLELTEIVLDDAERVANVLRDYFGTFRSQLCALAPFRSQIAFGDWNSGASKVLILLG